MAFIKNKILYVLNDSNKYVPMYTVNKEVFLTADKIFGLFSYDDYSKAVRSPLSQIVTRIYLLNDDETIRDEISEFLKSGNVDFVRAQGQTRSGTLSFMNFNNQLTPSPINDMLWKANKLRIDIGLYYNGTVYWKRCGIFTPIDPTIDENTRTLNVSVKDKFALLDGTISGKSGGNLRIAAGTSVRKAIEMCLLSDRGNNKSYDTKPIIFPAKYEKVTTPYTITRTPNYSVGEIIIELANMIFCDVYYNDDGHLVLTSGIEDTTVDWDKKPISWKYDEDELLYTNSNISIDYSKVVNIVSVVGAIQDGKQFKGTAKNENAMSQTNIYMTEPNIEEIEDSNIVGDENCLNRAKYELKNKTLLALSLKFKSIFIPSLLPNDIIWWSNDYLEQKNVKYVINSINLGFGTNNTMDISLTNLNEVAL